MASSLARARSDLELLGDASSSGFAHGRPLVTLRRRARRSRRPARPAPRGDEKSAHAILNQFRNAHDPRSDHRHAHGHRLHQNDRNALPKAREAERVGARVVIADLILADATQETHPVGDRQTLGLRPQRPRISEPSPMTVRRTRMSRTSRVARASRSRAWPFSRSSLPTVIRRMLVVALAGCGVPSYSVMSRPQWTTWIFDQCSWPTSTMS